MRLAWRLFGCLNGAWRGVVVRGHSFASLLVASTRPLFAVAAFFAGQALRDAGRREAEHLGGELDGGALCAATSSRSATRSASISAKASAKVSRAADLAIRHVMCEMSLGNHSERRSTNGRNLPIKSSGLSD